MRLPSLLTSRASLVTLGVVLIIGSSGCGVMTRHRNRELKKAFSQELIGVEDVVFHGYRKTCWRNWNEEAWSEQECPPSHDIQPNCKLPDIQEVPTVPETRFNDK